MSEKLLYSTELNLKTIINNTKFNIFLVNAELKFLEYNDAFKKEFDFLYSGNLKIGDSAVESPIPADMCKDWKRFYAIALSGKKHIQEYEFGGDPYIITLNPVIDEGVVVGIAVFSENIKETVELKENLKASEFRYHFAMDVSNSGFWDWNMITQEVYFSDIWKSMLGYKLDEIEHNYKSWEQLVHPDDLNLALKTIEDHINGKSQTYYLEHRLKSKGGEYKWVLAKGRIIKRQPEGEPVRFIGVHIDIDHLKRTEIDLKQKNSRLREIAYITSHGVRKSLANILGLTHIIDGADFSDKANIQLVPKIVEAAEDLNVQTMKLSETIRALDVEIFSFANKLVKPVKHVLLVDDDEISNLISTKFFSKAGLKSTAFTNPVLALDFLMTTQGKSVNLVLLDINMAPLNGWDFLERLQNQNIQTQVIMLTSSIFNSDKEKALLYNSVVDFWVKPLTKHKVQMLV